MKVAEDRLDYRDLEPLLCDTVNAAYLLYVAMEAGIDSAHTNIDAEDASALMYAVGHVQDCARRAKAHWDAVFEAERRKTAA